VNHPALHAVARFLDNVGMWRSRRLASVVALAAMLAFSAPAGFARPVSQSEGEDTDRVAAAVDCGVSLQSLIDAAMPNSVVKVPPCVYHETITISRPLTLDGQGQAEIRGSDVWAEWSRQSNSWVSARALPQFDAQHQGVCRDGSSRCNWPEQVFLDGRPLAEVAPGTTSDVGQFALDGGRHVVIRDDPTGHVMEVSTRERWVDTQADNVTIQGFTFWHAANSAETGAIGNQNRNGWTLQDSKLYYAHGGIVSIGGATNPGTETLVRRNTIAGSGYEGINGYKNTNVLIQGNTIYNNNLSGFDSDNWSGGGVKVSAFTNIVFDSNLVHDNDGPGLWCDIGCRGVVFSNNRVNDNAGAGILFEISDGALIFGNAVWNTGRGAPGVLISTSANAQVYGNALAWNPVGIAVYAIDRENRPAQGSVGISIHDNAVLAGSGDAAGLEWFSRGSGRLLDAGSGNAGQGNLFWYPGEEDGGRRFRWQTWIGSLSQFQATPGGSGGRYLSNDERDQLLQTWAIPGPPG
jgi:hypothetical protein